MEGKTPKYTYPYKMIDKTHIFGWHLSLKIQIINLETQFSVSVPCVSFYGAILNHPEVHHKKRKPLFEY